MKWNEFIDNDAAVGKKQVSELSDRYFTGGDWKMKWKLFLLQGDDG